MALKISDPRSFKLEPLKKNRWVFEFAAIPGNDSYQADALAFVAHTCNAPTLTFADVTTGRLNEQFKYAGNPTWNNITCSFYDFIRNSNDTSELSAGDILYNWSTMIYNPFTGQMGYKTQYATSATLSQLDPAGNVIRAWNIFGIFPTNINFGDGFDYNSSDISEVTAEFKYDLAIKITDLKSATESA
jgi:hypothetical protein